MDGPVILGAHQCQGPRKAAHIPDEGRQIPVGHHAQGARDMAGSGEEAPVIVKTCSVDGRARALDEPGHGARPRGTPSEGLDGERIEK